MTKFVKYDNFRLIALVIWVSNCFKQGKAHGMKVAVEGLK